jgi:hypothetical protein
VSGRTRSSTVSWKALAREERRERASGAVDPELVQLQHELEQARPRTRADCIDAQRPCPFFSCRWNLFLDVNPESGSVKFNFPDRDFWDLAETCALEVADRGGVTLDEVGKLMNVSRERIRQIEAKAGRKLGIRITRGER